MVKNSPVNRTSKLSLSKLLASWRQSYYSRRTFTTQDRNEFFAIAARYLPADKNAFVIDIGAGEYGFADYLRSNNSCVNLFLLDKNPETVEKLKQRFQHVVQYSAGDTLPFQAESVSYIHCSHLIEHLYHEQVLKLLFEVDRVLKLEGVLVISAPLLWESFYNGLSHVKPYNPAVLRHYLCSGSENRSGQAVSRRYVVKKLVYRYHTRDIFDEWGSEFMAVDFLIQTVRLLFRVLHIRRYTRNGYTIVLKKEKNAHN
jgi:SAM-dependent methyltransferase